MGEHGDQNGAGALLENERLRLRGSRASAWVFLCAMLVTIAVMIGFLAASPRMPEYLEAPPPELIAAQAQPNWRESYAVKACYPRSVLGAAIADYSLVELDQFEGYTQPQRQCELMNDVAKRVPELGPPGKPEWPAEALACCLAKAKEIRVE
jgi:hypothetical protein